MRLQPANKALKQTKGAEVRAPRHSAWQRTCSVPRSTFFTNVPSQLNAALGRLCGRGEMTMTRRAALLLGALLSAAVLSAETVTWEARALLGPGRSPAGHGVKTYQVAADIVVRDRRAKDGGVSWTKWLKLDDTFAIGLDIQRVTTIDGFGLVVYRRGDEEGFSWEWFDRTAGAIFERRQGAGRVRVTTTKVGALEEIASVELLDDGVLRYLDDMSKPPGTVTHELLLRRGSVLKVAP
jgi:hypothetical protein